MNLRNIKKFTIKTKLTIWYISILALILILFSTILYINLKKEIYNGVHNQLQLVAKEILLGLQEQDDSELENSYLLELSSKINEATPRKYESGLYSRDKILIEEEPLNNIIPETVDMIDNNFDIKKDSVDKKWAIINLAITDNEEEIIGWFRLAYDLRREEYTLREFIKNMVLGIPFALLLACIGGYFLALKALNPINRIIKTAQNISHTNLSRRIDESEMKDEIGKLIDTLNHLFHRLERAFNKERCFTADASHELRTPLAVIKSMLEEALNKDLSKEEYRETLEVIQKKTDYMNHLVQQLLLLARSDVEEQAFVKEELNLTELIHIVIEETIPKADDNGIKFIEDVEPNIKITGSQNMLIQLFMNLFDNALKYTPSGGTITVKARQKKDSIIVKVSDTGIGISPEHQKQIFNRFYRVDKSRSRETGGTGLGLAICQWIVEAHEGQISVESEPGQGSTFEIILPSA